MLFFLFVWLALTTLKAFSISFIVLLQVIPTSIRFSKSFFFILTTMALSVLNLTFQKQQSISISIVVFTATVPSMSGSLFPFTPFAPTAFISPSSSLNIILMLKWTSILRLASTFSFIQLACGAFHYDFKGGLWFTILLLWLLKVMSWCFWNLFSLYWFSNLFTISSSFYFEFVFFPDKDSGSFGVYVSRNFGLPSHLVFCLWWFFYLEILLYLQYMGNLFIC